MNTMTMERPAVKEHAVVTIQYVNEPKGNAVSGSIKDTNGDYWGVHKSGLHHVRGQEGQTVEFDFSISNGFRNVDVKSLHIVASNSSRSQSSPQRSAPVNQHVDPPQHFSAPQNGNGNGGNGGFNRPTHPRDAERMWVCSMLNAFIQTGRINDDVDTLERAVINLRQVWQRTFGLDDAAA